MGNCCSAKKDFKPKKESKSSEKIHKKSTRYRPPLNQRERDAADMFINKLNVFFEQPSEVSVQNELWKSLLQFVECRRPNLNEDKLFHTAWDSLNLFVDSHVTTADLSDQEVDELDDAVIQILARSL